MNLRSATRSNNFFQKGQLKFPENNQNKMMRPKWDQIPNNN